MGILMMHEKDTGRRHYVLCADDGNDDYEAKEQIGPISTIVYLQPPQ